MDPRFVRFELDGNDRRDRSRRETGVGKAGARQFGDLLLRAEALAADAERQDRGVDDEAIGFRRIGAVGHDDFAGRSRVPLDRSHMQPIGAAALFDERHPLPGEERGGDRLYPLGVGDAPAGRHLVERDAEPQIAGGGDRGNATEILGQRAGERVGAAMPAQQRHRDRTVLGEGDDRRLHKLVVDQGREGADQDAAREEADNRPAGGEELCQERHHPVVFFVPIARLRARFLARAIEPRPRQHGRNPAAERGASRSQYDDGGAGWQHPIQSPRPRQRTSAVAK